MIPRPLVSVVVLVLLAIVVADVAAQYVIPEHTVNLVLDGSIIALIGAIITGSKGPKPEEPPVPAPEPPASTAPLPAPRQDVVGRHHHRSEGPP